MFLVSLLIASCILTLEPTRADLPSEIIHTSIYFEGTEDLGSGDQPPSYMNFYLSTPLYTMSEFQIQNHSNGTYTLVDRSNGIYPDINSFLTNGSDEKIQFEFLIHQSNGAGFGTVREWSESLLFGTETDLQGFNFTSIKLVVHYAAFLDKGSGIVLSYYVHWEFWIEYVEGFESRIVYDPENIPHEILGDSVQYSDSEFDLNFNINWVIISMALIPILVKRKISRS